MKWCRLHNEFAHDPKVQSMSEAMQRRLVMLFCIQGDHGIETFHETQRDTLLACALRISIEELAETKAVFLRFGFINDDFTLCNWEERQYLVNPSTQRVRKFRERKALETNTETLPKRFSNAPRDRNRLQKQIQTAAAPAQFAAAAADLTGADAGTSKRIWGVAMRTSPDASPEEVFGLMRAFYRSKERNRLIKDVLALTVSQTECWCSQEAVAQYRTAAIEMAERSRRYEEEQLANEAERLANYREMLNDPGTSTQTMAALKSLLQMERKSPGTAEPLDRMSVAGVAN